MKKLKLGVDIGGTFTDLVLLDTETSRVWIDKSLTTPLDPSVGVITGLTRLTDKYRIGVEQVVNIIHATTLATNALIERKGAKTGLITTKGFKDVIAIAKENRYDLYDLHLEVPEPLVPRHLRVEVSERITSDGQAYMPLDVDDIKAGACQLREANVEAVAICFLHSYVNAEHEIMARQIVLEECPGMFVSVSHEVAGEIREYERTSTTVANAYVQPLVERYLGSLEDKLRNMGFGGSLYMMLSSGGLSAVGTAKKLPTRLIESGPAAGALVGSFYSKLLGDDNVMAFDMGGTTAKACLIHGGQPMSSFGFEAARVSRFKKGSGLPIRAPCIDLIEIGAGGGSIGYIDALGLLKVGPESAGASPGPACYGLGGLMPTVTDADLLLGYLNPDYFLGGEMELSVEAAKEALHKQVCIPLKVSEVKAASGIAEIVEENMAAAARVHIAERGHDPRIYTLIAMGGAGPMHAYRVAKKLGMRRVVCPLGAGIASAMGLLVAPPKVELVRGYVAELGDLKWERLDKIYEEMETEAIAVLYELGVMKEQVSLQRLADMRYVGQGHEVVVPVPLGRLCSSKAETLEISFQQRYEELYLRSASGLPIECLNWRLTALGPAPEVTFARATDVVPDSEPKDALKGQRLAFFPEFRDYATVNVYDRYGLSPGERGSGPAIIEERESTVLVGPDATFSVDPYQNLIIEL